MRKRDRYHRAPIAVGLEFLYHPQRATDARTVVRNVGLVPLKSGSAPVLEGVRQSHDKPASGPHSYKEVLAVVGLLPVIYRRVFGRLHVLIPIRIRDWEDEAMRWLGFRNNVLDRGKMLDHSTGLRNPNN